MRSSLSVAIFFFFSFFLFILPRQAAAIVDITYNPETNKIDESTATVNIKFGGLISGTEYLLCPLDNKMVCGTLGVEKGFAQVKTAISQTLDVTVCGDGDSLKTTCSDNDFFNANTTYHYFLFNKGGDKIATATFTAKRFFPDVTLTPTTNILPTTSLSLTISGTRRPHNDSNRNNYQISVEGENGTSKPTPNDFCTIIPPLGSSTQPLGPYPLGDYRVEVSEQVNEGTSSCSDGFIYTKIHFTVRTSADGGGKVTSVEGGKDSAIGGAGINPCGSTCETAIGNVPIQLKALSTKILTIATGLAGGLALILMVIGSVRVLTSSGDQQRLNGGREMIVAAVAGLLFLIFAVLILRFIGFQILGGIPGIT